MKIVRIGLFAALMLLASLCAAILEHKTVQYPTNLRLIRGRVTGYGATNPGVVVRVFDNPSERLNGSVPFQESRAKQKLIAQVNTKDDGRFAFKQVPDGLYEVEFTHEGWDILSVIVLIDHQGASDKMCVELRISGGAGTSSVEKCR